MKIDFKTYVPILKWRMGEYQALYRLSNEAKESITPLLLIPPIEYDFEEEKMKKTADEHILPFPKKFDEKWGKGKALIDIHESLELASVTGGKFALEHVFDELRERECAAIPVAGMSRVEAYTNQVQRIVNTDKRGVCLRASFTELMRHDFNTRLTEVCKKLGVGLSDIDIVLDLGEPENFEPLDVFAKLVLGKMRSINGLDDFRSLVVAGMSLKLSEVKKPGGEVPRLEWALYKEIITRLADTRIPSYGDYTVETPKFLEMDMRLINPAGKIVYTCDNTWLIPKGGSFRKDNSQMTGHCAEIMKSGHYSGSKFSFGDKRITDTGNGLESCGNQTTWKQVAVNHHIEKVVDQLANYSFS